MTPRTMWKRVLVVGAAIAGAAVVVAVLAALYGPVSDVATPQNKDRAAAVNATRQVLLATAAGIAALIGLGFTGRTFYLTRRGQLTDRYTKAITQLASTDKLTERLGGIYALEHLMRESSRDHETVVDVLAAFIRENAPIGAATEGAAATGGTGASTAPASHKRGRPATDVQAALTVLGRRPVRPEANPLNLAHNDLSGAKLGKANFRGAELTEADLQGADLTGAQLQGADLTGAQLEEANLEEAQLQDAFFMDANLRGAFLSDANLQGAVLAAASLHGAILTRAQLQGATVAYADLRDADVTEANLAGAELRGADLTGALIQGAKFLETDFTGEFSA